MKLSPENRILLSLLALATSATGQNVISNPGFESSVAGSIPDNGGVTQWGNFNVTAGNSVVQSTTVHSGSNALAVNVNPTGTQGFTIIYQNSGATLTAAQVENRVWSYSFWAYTPGGSGTLDYSFPASNPDNQDMYPAGSSGVLSASAIPANTWTQVTGTFTTTDYSPDRTRMKANFISINGTSTFYIDDINLSPVEPPRWLGTSGTGWGTAANWNPTGVPLATDSVLFGRTGSVGIVDLGGARTQAGITFESAVSTTIGSAGAALTLSNGEAPALVSGEGMHTISAPLVLGSPLKVTGTAGTVTLSGAASGDFGLTKEGAGTLTLSGANTYTGTTTVTAGTLLVNGGSSTSPVTVSGNGALGGSGNTTTSVTVGSGGKLVPGGTGTTGTLALDDLTLNAGGVVELEFGSPVHDALNVDTLTLNAGTLRLLAAGTSNAFETPGVYTIATFSTISGNPATVTVANPAVGRNYSLGVVGNTLRLTVSVGVARFWNGGGNPDTQWNTPANWGGSAIVNGARLEFGASPTAPASNNNVASGSYQSLVFGAAAPSYQITGNAVTLTADASANAVMNDSANAQAVSLPISLPNTSGVVAVNAQVTLSGNLSGSGSLVKKGTKLVVLSGNNSFSGGVTVEPGSAVPGEDATLVGVGSAGALGTGPLVLPSAGLTNVTAGPLTLSTTNSQTWSGDVSFKGPGLTMGASAASLTADTILRVDDTLSVGSVGGAPRLSLESGTLSLTAASALPLGELQQNGGLLKLTSGSPALTFANFESFRQRSTTSAHLEMSTGALTIPGRWRLGYDFANGSATVTGGTVAHTNGDLELGYNGGQANVTFGGNAVYDGTGRLVQIGEAWRSKSTLTIRDNAVVTTADLVLGGRNEVPNNVPEDLSHNLSNLTVRDSASLNVGTDLIIGRLQSGTGTLAAQFNQLGGNTFVAGAVRMGRDGAVPGFLHSNLNLLGGSFTTSEISTTLQDSVVSFQGGTLRIAVSENSPLGAGTIHAAHAIAWQDARIEVNENIIGDMTVPLVSPVDSGVGSVAVGNGGSGYNRIPPMVRFSGGSGHGATGVAVIDPVTGSVTGISITCPGSGYLTGQEPVVELLGGDGTGALPGTVTLASNTSATGGLVKSGAGTLKLSPSSSYRGDTTVQAGVLSLVAPSLDDNSTVRLETGASLYLDTLATDTVKRLFIGGVQQAAGTWGPLDSGAQHETAAITGYDFLLVTESPGASPYLQWAGSFGAGFNGTNNGPNQDPDNDGIRNQLEFVLGGSPLVSDSSKQPSLTLDSSNLTFTFKRADQSEAEISLTVEYGTNLTGWTSIPIGAASLGQVTVTEGGATPDVVVVTIPRSSSAGGKLFARLRAKK